MKKTEKRISLLVLAGMVLMSACPLAHGSGQERHDETFCAVLENPYKLSTPWLDQLAAKQVNPPQSSRMRMAVVGDLMVHGPQIRAQFQPDTGTYDFHNNFDYVRPWFREADLVMGNLETTFGGETRGYSSFPKFNTPDAFAEALREAGFSLVSTVNNHTIDTGAAGFYRTLEVLDANMIKAVGTRAAVTEPFWELISHNGITVGVTAASYETPRAFGRRTLNALLIPENLEPLILSFGYENLENDMAPVLRQFREMRDAGADVTAIMIHWGEEYQTQPNQWQRRIAHQLASAGADLVLGSHPHVIQPAAKLQPDEEGPVAWTAYSMGNFLSNQRFEILRRHDTEDGMVLFVDLIRDPVHGLVEIEQISYLATWVHRYTKQGNLVYEILPLPHALEDPVPYGLVTPESLNRATASYERTRERLSMLEPAEAPLPMVLKNRDRTNALVTN